MSPIAAIELPREAGMVQAAGVVGVYDAYYLNGQWFEALEGEDRLILDTIVCWEVKAAEKVPI